MPITYGDNKHTSRAALGRFLPLAKGFSQPQADGDDRQKSTESGWPKGQWTFHAAFLKVGEEQSHKKNRCCKPLFCVVNLTDLQIKKAVYRRLKNIVNDRSVSQPNFRPTLLSSPNTTAYS
jgi:hypothetical protein